MGICAILMYKLLKFPSDFEVEIDSIINLFTVPLPLVNFELIPRRFQLIIANYVTRRLCAIENKH